VNHLSACGASRSTAERFVIDAPRLNRALSARPSRRCRPFSSRRVVTERRRGRIDTCCPGAARLTISALGLRCKQLDRSSGVWPAGTRALRSTDGSHEDRRRLVEKRVTDLAQLRYEISCSAALSVLQRDYPGPACSAGRNSFHVRSSMPGAGSSRAGRRTWSEPGTRSARRRERLARIRRNFIVAAAAAAAWVFCTSASSPASLVTSRPLVARRRSPKACKPAGNSLRTRHSECLWRANTSRRRTGYSHEAIESPRRAGSRNRVGQRTGRCLLPMLKHSESQYRVSAGTRARTAGLLCHRSILLVCVSSDGRAAGEFLTLQMRSGAGTATVSPANHTNLRVH